MYPKTKIQIAILWTTALTATNGCDDHATRIAREAADRQAQQNTVMSELNKEVASGAHGLVTADAQTRKEIVGVHHDLQAERTRLDSGWNNLEQERRAIAGERRTESMLVAISQLVGGLLLVSVLLGFCWHALVVSRTNDVSDAQLSELLLQEILPGEPTPTLNNNHFTLPLNDVQSAERLLE